MALLKDVSTESNTGDWEMEDAVRGGSNYKNTQPYEPGGPPQIRPYEPAGPAEQIPYGNDFLEIPINETRPDRATLQELYPEKPELGDFDTPTVGSPVGASARLTDKDAARIDAYGSNFDTEEFFKDAQENVLGQAGGGSRSSRSDNQLVDKDLARIMQQDSPLLSQARQEGMRLAAARGLQNSSMAAGQAYGQMVKAALPMAQQNAAQEYQRSVENARLAQEHAQFRSEQAARLAALEAELGVEMSLFNADQLNQAERLTAQLRTAMEQQDAQAINEISMQLAQLRRDAQAQQAEIDYAGEERRFLENQAYNEQILDSLAQLNERYMIGETQVDITRIQETYRQLISTNETAANTYNNAMTSIADVLRNHELSPAQAQEAIRSIMDLLNGSMRLMSEMNDMDFGDLGGDTGGGGGGGGGRPRPNRRRPRPNQQLDVMDEFGP